MNHQVTITPEQDGTLSVYKNGEFVDGGFPSVAKAREEVAQWDGGHTVQVLLPKGSGVVSTDVQYTA